MKKAGNQKVVDGLRQLLADTYVLYLKTQNFHWNVQGMHFHSLHKMFEGQYEELAEAIDTIAERIRALDAPTPASFTEFLKLTSLKENTKTLTAEAMLAALLYDHESVIAQGENLFNTFQKCGDEVTGDLMLSRLDAHQKTAWMLRSTLGKI